MLTEERFSTCICGNKAQLFFKDQRGRYKDKIVTVTNVPIWYCNQCKDGFFDGSVSRRYAKKVKEATEKGLEVIVYE